MSADINRAIRDFVTGCNITETKKVQSGESVVASWTLGFAGDRAESSRWREFRL